MRKFAANKLIRDKLPEMIKTDNGTHLDCVILSHDDTIHALKKKLIEEANEVLAAESDEELLCEIADVLEVLDGLYYHLRIDIKHILERKAAKREAKGGFENGVYCRTVNVDERDADMMKVYENKAEYVEVV